MSGSILKSHDDVIQSIASAARFSRGAEAATHVQKAISNPDVFVFGELYDLAGVQELQNHREYADCFTLLELFAFGTWSDYVTARKENRVPELRAPDAWKLKQLSLVTLASGPTKTLPYQALCTAFDLPSTRILEDLVLACLDSGLINAHLDPAAQVVRVTGCMGRDIRDAAEASALSSILGAWVSNVQTCQSQLDSATIKETNHVTSPAEDFERALQAAGEARGVDLSKAE